MRFGAVPLEEGRGHVLAHGHRLPSGRISKGTVLGQAEIDALRAAGIDEVVVARLDEGDVAEDEAAEALARAAAGPGLRVRAPFTGRCNVVAESAGLALVEADALRGANRIDESLTLATVPPFSPVGEGRLVATAKVIPMAVPGTLVDRVTGALRERGPVVRLAPFRPVRAALVLTEQPGSRERLMEKAEEVTRARLEALGSTVDDVRRSPHDAAALAEVLAELGDAGHDLLLVLGASAVVDRADVVPRAVERAGGRVERLGLPVDPGNLLLLARLGDAPVVGIPGCARSPKRSGFDQVLERLLAGLELEPDAFADMAVGGLLAEIPSRPQPREGSRAAEEAPARARPRTAALVLAAGRSSRMGEVNKLTATVDGRPMVAGVVDAAREAGLDPVVVVTGPDPGEVEEALRGRSVRMVPNPDAERGMSTSLGAGVAALEGDEVEGGAVEGVMVCLGDMPRLRPDTLRALADALEPDAGRSICVPVHERKRGNPVLFAARWLPELRGLEGDVGGRSLLMRFADEVHEVEVDDPGVLLDVDTPEALDALRRGDV